MHYGGYSPIPQAVAQAMRVYRSRHVTGWALLLAAVSLFSWFLLSGVRTEVTLVLGVLSIVTAWLVFLTGYQAMASARGGAVVLLGILFLGVGLLEFFVLMAESDFGEKMPADASRQQGFFRLVASAVASLGLLVYVALPPTTMPCAWRRYGALGLVLLVVGLVGYTGVVQPDGARIFLTEIQRDALPHSWWARGVIMTNGVTLACLWFRRQQLADESRAALVLALLLLAASSYFGLLRDGALADGLSVLCRVTAYSSLLEAIRAAALHLPIAQLGRQAQRERAVIEAAPDGILMVDEGGRILLVSPTMEQLSGYRASDLVGQTVDIFLSPPMREKHAELIRGYFRQPSRRPMGAVASLQLHRRDGTGIPIDIALGQWHEGGRPYAVAFIRDMSEHKRQEERLRHQATHDELTDLPNRWLFRHHLDRALVRAGRSGRRVALLFLDLDHFKVVNDSFGHACGDALLMQVARRLGAGLRESDTLARLGGDEFAVLLTDLESTEEAISVASKLLSMFAAPYRVQEQDVYSGGSLGMAFYPDDAQDGDALLRCADMAMYQAKQAGRGSHACYSERLGQRMREDLDLHTRLRQALDQNRLMLHYQPLVDTQSGSVVGVEALLRWHDEELGEVSPARFIPVAEATGLILPLSDWVLDMACRQIAAWVRAGTPLKVAVNLSWQLFRQSDVGEKIQSVLARSGAPASLLEVEITETATMGDPELACRQLSAIAAMGISIALDDFGTGHSSLAYLKALPVTKLKIDRGFIKDIPGDAHNTTLVRTMIALACNMGLQVVAEGVETEDQRAFLHESGCQVCQGWLFSRAVPVADISSMLPVPA